MERRVATAWLLDLYGPLLTARQRTLLSMHYEEDLSLAEIAQQEGISRQGAHDAIRRGEQQLIALEARLGLLRRTRRMVDALEVCREALRSDAPQLRAGALAAIERTLADEEGSDGL